MITDSPIEQSALRAAAHAACRHFHGRSSDNSAGRYYDLCRDIIQAYLAAVWPAQVNSNNLHLQRLMVVEMFKHDFSEEHPMDIAKALLDVIKQSIATRGALEGDASEHEESLKGVVASRNDGVMTISPEPKRSDKIEIFACDKCEGTGFIVCDKCNRGAVGKQQPCETTAISDEDLYELIDTTGGQTCNVSKVMEAIRPYLSTSKLVSVDLEKEIRAQSIFLQALNEISALADGAFGKPHDFTARCGDIAKNAIMKSGE